VPDKNSATCGVFCDGCGSELEYKVLPEGAGAVAPCETCTILKQLALAMATQFVMCKQKEYFKSRSKEDLVKAKDIEKRMSDALVALLNKALETLGEEKFAVCRKVAWEMLGL